MARLLAQKNHPERLSPQTEGLRCLETCMAFQKDGVGKGWASPNLNANPVLVGYRQPRTTTYVQPPAHMQKATGFAPFPTVCAFSCSRSGPETCLSCESPSSLSLQNKRNPLETSQSYMMNCDDDEQRLQVFWDIVGPVACINPTCRAPSCFSSFSSQNIFVWSLCE